jgi:hypothetical protein
LVERGDEEMLDSSDLDGGRKAKVLGDLPALITITFPVRNGKATTSTSQTRSSSAPIPPHVPPCPYHKISLSSP